MAGQLSPTNVMPLGWLAAYESTIVTVVEYAEIWSSLDAVAEGGTQTMLAGPLTVVGGTVTIDRANAIRRTASNVTFLPDEVTFPTAGAASGLLTPYGNELRLYRGVFVNGGVMYASLGHFLIGEVDVKDDANGITLVGTCNDNGEWFSRLTLTAPFSLPTNLGFLGNSEAAIDIFLLLIQAINSYFPLVSSLPIPHTFSGSVPTDQLPTQTWAAGDDMWKACQDIAGSAGCQLYFDYSGTLILEPIPDPSTITPCVSYVEGTTTAYTTAARAVSNKSVPNVIRVESSGSGVATPIAVYWWDSNPSSPTYYAPAPGGGFGTPQTTLPTIDPAATYSPFQQKFTTNLAQTAGLAQVIANAIGLTSIGSIEKGTFTIRDQPAHDVDDVIEFTRVAAGIPSLTKYVVDHVQIDLGITTPLSLTTRVVL